MRAFYGCAISPLVWLSLLSAGWRSHRFLLGEWNNTSFLVNVKSTISPRYRISLPPFHHQPLGAERAEVFGDVFPFRL